MLKCFGVCLLRREVGGGGGERFFEEGGGELFLLLERHYSGVGVIWTEGRREHGNGAKEGCKLESKSRNRSVD